MQNSSKIEKYKTGKNYRLIVIFYFWFIIRFSVTWRRISQVAKNTFSKRYLCAADVDYHFMAVIRFPEKNIVRTSFRKISFSEFSLHIGIRRGWKSQFPALTHKFWDEDSCLLKDTLVNKSRTLFFTLRSVFRKDRRSVHHWWTSRCPFRFRRNVNFLLSSSWGDTEGWIVLKIWLTKLNPLFEKHTLLHAISCVKFLKSLTCEVCFQQLQLFTQEDKEQGEFHP